MQLRKAVRSRQHLRLCLCSPSGGGKTFTALRLAHALGGPIGVVDTENGSSELYAGEPNPDGGVFDFSTIDLAQEPGKFSVDNYVKALSVMARAGIRTAIVDSGTHAWAGPGGVLEYVDEVARRSRGANKFNAWAEGTPKHHEFLQALLSYPGHLIVTLRTKVEYVQEVVNGRTTIRKVGMAPIQREGLEYEMTLVGDLEADTHRLVVTKSRCSALADKSFDKPGADMARALLRWLDTAPTQPDTHSTPPAPAPRPRRGTPEPTPPQAGVDVPSGRDGLAPSAPPPGEADIPFDVAGDPLPAPSSPPALVSPGSARTSTVSEGAPGNGHHESWEGHKRAFFASLQRIPDTTYEDLCWVLESLGKDRPSATTTQKREEVLNWLRSEKGLRTFRARLAALRQRAELMEQVGRAQTAALAHVGPADTLALAADAGIALVDDVPALDAASVEQLRQYLHLLTEAVPA